MEYGQVSYQFEVFADGRLRADGDAPTLELAQVDVRCYVRMFLGVIEVKYYERREIIVQ